MVWFNIMYFSVILEFDSPILLILRKRIFIKPQKPY